MSYERDLMHSESNLPMLSLEQVSFSYPNRIVLEDVSLGIPRRSFLALIGPNGSGKTTLLRIMSRVLQPQRGRVLLEGHPISRLSARALAKKIAVISSEQSFEFPFSVRDVAAMGRFPHLNRMQRMTALDWEIVEGALKMTCTEALESRPISQLSSGERQRVLVARAIAQEPSVLLLDEPNAHLDISHQIAIFNLLRSLKSDLGVTIVVVLHDLIAAAAFCESVLLLHQGRIVKAGRPEEVITAELIRKTYGADVHVFPSPLGGFPQIAFGPASEP
jgi:iron complex transport system ATP-binding protein